MRVRDEPRPFRDFAIARAVCVAAGADFSVAPHPPQHGLGVDETLRSGTQAPPA